MSEKKLKKIENSYLVGIKFPDEVSLVSEEHLAELEELVNTMNLPSLGKEVVLIRKPNAKYFIGSGKVEEIGIKAKEHDADCIVVDFDLSPSQQRNWEKTTGLCVIDRQEVILDIFANRAKTREAVIQVELARMEYSLPRLTRAWTHLSRQRGGNTGARGEGEKQLETDRRLVQNRITYLKEELKEISKHRVVQRTKRGKTREMLGAIVGYTNAGKSSLLNLLSGADVFVEDKLFATLDPTSKIVDLPNKQKVILTDTVGFIRKLPHNLVEAFKSTLEEVVVSDFIIHVLDLSNESVEDHYKTTINLLGELKSSDKPTVLVFNKLDKVKDDNFLISRIRSIYPEAVFISTYTQEGVLSLLEQIQKTINKKSSNLTLKIPVSKFDVVSKLYRVADVMDVKYEEEFAIIQANLPTDVKDEYLEYSTYHNTP